MSKTIINIKCTRCNSVLSMLKQNYNRAIKRLGGSFVCRKCILSSKKHKNKMKSIYESDSFKKKVSTGVKDAFKKPNQINTTQKTTKFKKEASIRTKQLWENENYKCNVIDSHNTNEHKAKMSELGKKPWKDSKFKKKISELTTKRNEKMWNDPKYCKKMDRFFNDPENKKRMSESSKKMWEDSEYREKMAVVRSQQPRISSIEKMLYSWLDDLGIKYTPQYQIGYYVFDCFLPEYNILIECQGEYWHSLKESIRNDKSKATYIEKYFPQYLLKYVWEHEFYTKDRIFNTIKYWCGLSEQKSNNFDLGDIKIEKTKRVDVGLFLSKHHYLQNAGVGGIVYGAYLNNELIACCVFSPPTRKEVATRLNYKVGEIRELSRFCIHPSYQKKNFGSWFISRCLKEISQKYKMVVSFCDTTYNHDGALYKSCNFKLDGKTNPDYWYVDKNGYVMHKKTLYQRATKMKMKEKEYAKNNGYSKIWGKEKLRFIYEFGV